MAKKSKYKGVFYIKVRGKYYRAFRSDKYTSLAKAQRWKDDFEKRGYPTFIRKMGRNYFVFTRYGIKTG